MSALFCLISDVSTAKQGRFDVTCANGVHRRSPLLGPPHNQRCPARASGRMGHYSFIHIVAGRCCRVYCQPWPRQRSQPFPQSSALVFHFLHAVHLTAAHSAPRLAAPVPAPAPASPMGSRGHDLTPTNSAVCARARIQTLMPSLNEDQVGHACIRSHALGSPTQHTACIPIWHTHFNVRSTLTYHREMHHAIMHGSPHWGPSGVSPPF